MFRMAGRSTLSRVTAADLDAFVRVFEDSDWDDVSVVIGEVSLHLSRQDGHTVASHSILPAVSGQTDRRDEATLISAPHVSTFRHGAALGTSPCVKPGDAVAPDTVVCSLQVMDRLIAMKAGRTGTIRQVCVVDGALVQCGDALFVIDVASASEVEA